MGYLSTSDPVFLDHVERWIEENGEVSALIRYSHGAGGKSFEFFSTMSTLLIRLGELSPKDCMTVFRERQLSLRGRIDDDFIASALSILPEQTEYMIAGLELIEYGRFKDHIFKSYIFLAGETHSELEEDLHDSVGATVAVGVYPPWLYDNENVISAVVPQHDGNIVTGVY